MRTSVVLVTLGLVGVFSLTIVASDPPPADYQAAMKTLGAAMQTVAKDAAAKEMDFDALVAAAKLMADPFKVTATFWDLKKTSDALEWAKTGGMKAFDLQTAAALGSEEGVQFALKELQTQCGACHARHREQMPDKSFQIKY